MKVELMLCATLALPLAVRAELPPPPEEAAKKQEAAQKKARDENSARAALTRAQNRVAERYHAAHTPPVQKPARSEEAEPIPESEASIEE
ncbi:MAG TPA: hypothetical protein PKW44_02885 [Methylophilaceae bacterium]|nr:hypothetical protein [Methylophilaceae bacterium]HQR61089.1 hypothetical protein [Methylophilaceae bacterium]